MQRSLDGCNCRCRCRRHSFLFCVIFLSTLLFLLVFKIIGSGSGTFDSSLEFQDSSRRDNLNFKAVKFQVEPYEKSSNSKQENPLGLAHTFQINPARENYEEFSWKTSMEKEQEKLNKLEVINGLEKFMEQVKFTSIYENRKLSDFQPDFGGHPIANLLVTTFRSGSSFLGQVLSQPLGTYYYFEPFMVFKKQETVRCRVTTVTNVTPILRNMLKCKFDCFQRAKISPPVPEGEKMYTIPQLGTRGICGVTRFLPPIVYLRDKHLLTYCADQKYMDKVCSKFPIQTMKIVDVSLKQVQGILEDENPNVRILYLIRDPRGTWLSRRKIYDPQPMWREDWDLDVLCSGLLDDYHVAMEIAKKHPQKFKIVRFENLAKDPWNMTKKIYSFFHLPFGPEIQEYLKTHTVKAIMPKRRSDPPFIHSTYRNSSTISDAWIRDAKIKEHVGKKGNFEKIVTDVQKECGEAMKLWGYTMVNSVDELNENFNPIQKTHFSHVLI